MNEVNGMRGVRQSEKTLRDCRGVEKTSLADDGDFQQLNGRLCNPEMCTVVAVGARCAREAKVMLEMLRGVQ